MESVSIVIPTLNSEAVLGNCLSSIRSQNYSQSAIQIVVVDGGSSDRTVEIAESFGAMVLNNPLRTAEAAKALGCTMSSGDIVAFIDSDNVLSGDDWLETMLAPFSDQLIDASEPLGWDIRYGGLSFIDKYCALTGVNDPFCLYLGNYGRFSYLTSRWTDYEFDTFPGAGYFWFTITPGDRVPTMGANGFLIRRCVLGEVIGGPLLFDIDLIGELVAARGMLNIARVYTTIAHLYARDWLQYYRKAQRRARDFYYYSESGDRSYPWHELARGSAVLFVLDSVLVVPGCIQAFKGYRKVPDSSWSFHPIACFLTALAYVGATMRARLFGPQLHSRAGWKQ